MAMGRLNVIRIVVFSFITFLYGINDLYSQNIYKNGLIKEDLSKIPWIKKGKSLMKRSALPASVDLSSKMPPVQNQGSQNSCVGWALGYYYKTYQEWQERGWNVNIPDHQFSPAFIYNQINGGVDDGSFFSEALSVLVNHGCATIADMPYNVSNFALWPNENAYTNAIQYKCAESFYVTLSSEDDINIIKQRLADGNLTVIGINIYANYGNISQYNNNYCVANISGEITAGHAIAVVGYDDNRNTADGMGAFKFINSHGTGWGENGFFWISYKGIIDPNLSQQAALYTSDLKNYSPSVIVKTNLTQSLRGSVNMNIGILRNETEVFRKKYFDYGKAKAGDRHPFPSTNIVLDFSEGNDYLDSNAENTIFIECFDTNTAGVTGTLNYFSVNHLIWNRSAISAGLPKPIPTNGNVLSTGVIIAKAFSISGTITGSNGIAIPGVTVNLSGFSSAGVETDYYGYYYFPGLMEGKNYIITPEKTNYSFLPPNISITNLSGSLINRNFIAQMAKPDKVILSEPANQATNIPLYTTLRWEEISSVDHYRLQVSTNNIFTGFIFDDSSLTAAYRELNDLVSNTTYYWRVCAKNFGGTGEWSATWSFTTVGKPGAVTLLSPLNGTTEVSLNPSLSWNAVTGADSYRMQISTSASFTNLYFDDSSFTSSSTIINNLAENTKYYWRVAAKNEGGTGAWSAVWNFTTTGKPGIVNLISPQNGAKEISINPVLSWESLSGSVSYKLQVSTSASFLNLIYSDSNIITTNKTLNNLANKTGYYWRISAKNAIGYGQWSGVWNFTTIEATPSIPVMLNPQNNSSINLDYRTPIVTLNWSPAQNAAYYRLQVSENSAFTSLSVEKDSLTGSSYILNNLKSVKYYWKIKALNGSVSSDWSLAWSFSPNITSVKLLNDNKPESYGLSQNYPNPFNPGTVIGFQLSASGYTTLKVYDVLGKEVKTLLDNYLEPGEYSVTFEAGDIPGGTYFYKLQSEGFSAIKKMIFVK